MFFSLDSFPYFIWQSRNYSPVILFSQQTFESVMKILFCVEVDWLLTAETSKGPLSVFVTTDTCWIRSQANALVCVLNVMAYLRCQSRTRTRILTPIPTPNLIATLYCTETVPIAQIPTQIPILYCTHIWDGYLYPEWDRVCARNVNTP